MKKGILKNGTILCSLLAFMVIFMSTKSQTTAITGYVYDDANTALIGASIVEKGTNNGTTTNINGYFELEVRDKNAILKIDYVGFESQEVKLTMGQSMPLKIYLTSPVELSEIVIASKRNPSKIIFKRKNHSSPKILAEHTSDFVVQYPAGIVGSCNEPHNTEEYDFIQENTFIAPTVSPLSTFSIDVDAASYSNLRRFINQGQQPPKDAVRIEEMVNYFDYDYPQPTGEDPFEVITEYSDCPWNADHRLLHIGLQGKEIPKDNLPASNLVFLCDVSGSMQSSDKLPLLQSSLKMLTNNLRSEDKVSLVVYAGSSGVVLAPTGGDQKAKIREAIDGLFAGGSTAGAEGIELAYKQAKSAFIKGGNNRIILATDGDFNVGMSSDAELIRLIEKERDNDIFLTVMGFGTGNLKDNKMEKIADHGNGNYAYIDNINEARKVLVKEFGGTLFTIAKDVKLQLEFNPNHVAGYRLIGYENRLLNKEDFNDDKKDAGELGAGHTVTAMYEIIPAGVKSKFMKSVDALKYQKIKDNKKTSYADELLTLKLRYKQPEGKESKLLSKVVANKASDLNVTSDNFRWAATVAGFGMLLRDSEFRQEATYKSMMAMGENAMGEDLQGYRSEMLRMMKNVAGFSDRMTAEK